MENQAIYNTYDDFVYLKIPNEYYCVYKKLLIDLSTLGIKGLSECKELRLPHCFNNTTLYNWNMFQIALAAYELKELEKADNIINHINSTMSYCCPKVERVYSNILFYGEVDIKPIASEILNSREFLYSKEKELVFPIYKKGHFIAINPAYSIKTIENSVFNGDWLYNTELGIDFYTKEEIILNGKTYILWYCEFAIPFNAGIKVTLTL